MTKHLITPPPANQPTNQPTNHLDPFGSWEIMQRHKESRPASISGASPLRSSTPRIPIAMPAEMGTFVAMIQSIWCWQYEIFTLHAFTIFHTLYISIYIKSWLGKIAWKHLLLSIANVFAMLVMWYHPLQMFLLFSGPTKPPHTNRGHLEPSVRSWSPVLVHPNLSVLLALWGPWHQMWLPPEILLQPKRLRWLWNKEEDGTYLWSK